MEFNFDNIRYYNDEDFRRCQPELAEEPTLVRILNYYQPGITPEQVKDFIFSFKTIDEFQLTFIIKLIEKIVTDSTDSITYSGIENLEPDKKYLFLTNHRNIVMDVAMLNYVLYKNLPVFQSTAIAIGDNLLGIPWVKHLARINKSFLVERDLPAQDMLMSAKRLSYFIRHILTSKENSIWIAHREGRTKDGNDQTQAGLIKMLTMSGEGLFSENLSELHILPVAISYENDPCDIMKINELYTIQSGQKYVKGPMEDFNSMFAGMMGQKGRVHYHFGEELTKEKLLKINENIPVNQKVRNLCDYIDRFIYSQYRLFEKNYIATDLLNDSNDFAHLYSTDSKQKFVETMNEKLSEISFDSQIAKDIFLKMFANPVKNYYSTMDHNYSFKF
ncbi:MAG: 1-acyl-sn-glycerol-3-phosphate acyltransferase [Bacteroidales bacterium]|nr:1-acyl-sn-glycerol-3-phosphate acyltransferase [Bacteroidales bacterium]